MAFLDYTIPNILVHFGQSLSPQATAALEEKEALMREEIESHRVEIINLQGRCTVLNRSLEEQIRIRNIREKETGNRDENEQLQAEICKLKVLICELNNGMFDFDGYEMILENSIQSNNVFSSSEKEAMESELDELRTKERELVESNNVLIREKKVMELELDQLRKKTAELQKVKFEKNGVVKRKNETQKRNRELAERIDVLESQKVVMEAELDELRKGKWEEYEAIKAELDKSQKTVSQQVVTIKQKSAMIKSMEIDVRKRTSELVEEKHKLKEENERILREMADVEAIKNRVDAELKKEKGGKKREMEKIMKQKLRVEEENSKLIEIIQAKEEEVLKSHKERNSVICRMQKLNKASEQARFNLEKDKEISDLEKRVAVLESEKAKLEVMNSKNSEVIEGLMKVNEVSAAKILKVSIEKNNEIERIKIEKLALEEQKKTITENLKRTEVLETEKLELKAKVCRLLKADMEKRKEIERISNEKLALEEEEKNKILDHVKRIEVLEQEKAELKAKVCEVLIDKKNESEKVVKLNKDLQTQKSLAEAADKHASGILETIIVVEREKEELQAEVLKLNKEKSKDIERTERLERIQKILNGNIAQEAEKDYEKKNLELGDRIIMLEKEKRGLAADLRKKNEAIMVLEHKNRLLEDRTKELEISGMVSKSKEEGTNGIGGMLTNPLQNEGQNAAAVHRAIVNTNGNASKRKRTPRKFDGPVRKRPISACEPLLISPGEPVLPQPEDLVPCEKNAQMISATHSNGSSVSDVRVACRWEVDQDVMDSLDVDDELCLKAVCALYRKHIADASTSSESRVFKEPESTLRAITIGEYLTIEDPDCRKMKKMVGKLNKLDNLALGACRTIAKEHYKQVFEIYNNKEDPLYLS